MRFRIDTASISYTANKFAHQVADAYIVNDWLGLGTASREKAVARVRDVAIDLYNGVLDDVRRGDYDYDGGYHFHSTGRVKVIYWKWDEEPDEIEFLLNVEFEMPDDDGVWQNSDYWDEE